MVRIELRIPGHGELVVSHEPDHLQRKFQAPDLHNAMRDETFVEPGTPTEQRIATMVAKLLGLERVGINDNFFLLGGNSLLGTQVIARVRNNFDVDLTLLSLFDHPTVAGIAGEVEQLIAAKLETMSEEEAQRLVDLSEQRTSL